MAIHYVDTTTTMASNIVTPNQFVPSEHMLFTKPKVNSVGGKSIGILNSQTRRSLMVKTPLMLNWGVNVFENANGSNSYSFSLQFPRDEFSNESTNSFLSMLKDMEDKIKTSASENSKEWFGKNQPKEVIEAFWNPILKYPKGEDGEPDLSRSPTIKVKLPTWDGEYRFELFDTVNTMLIPNSDEKTPEEFIQKGSNIACILQCGGLWFANGNFGCSWKLYQGVVKPTESLVKGQCHITLSSEDGEQMTNDKTAEFASTSQSQVESDNEDEDEPVASNEESNEEEQEQEEEAEPEPEPEPEPEKPKKKRVVKKKE
tara:strand:+ start:1031 stop:1975 length:945 start_codon:yes stop_codon:yes gene_type:complete